ncbi:unnamed protein product [Moneuplotes crassus]|uniref:Uncharacterized protein n=1 Tax=Euplotes crassus TaxID=5936 RepID=A0AAD1Y633_EUPCR|nr:unnamed protein product [Moneuplotes crassus]
MDRQSSRSSTNSHKGKKKQASEEDKVTEIIVIFSKHLEQETLSQTIIDVFFEIMDNNKKLPKNSEDRVINMFLSSLISVISLKEDDQIAYKCLKILTKFLKNDNLLLTKFKPNSLILKKMNFDFWIQRPEFSKGAIDLVTFLLRFYTSIDYESFSDKTDIINLLKRSEMLKCWTDLEDLATGVDSFHKKSEETLTSHSKYISTLNKKIDKNTKNLDSLNTTCNEIKIQVDRIVDKTQNELRNEIISECRSIVKVRMDEMVDLVEKFATLVKTTERKQKEFEQRVEQKYALQSTRKDQIEDILKDHIDLIKKLHSQQQGCTDSVTELSKEVNEKIKEVKDDMSIKNKLFEFEKDIIKFSETMDEFKTDQNSFKLIIEEDLESWKSISQNMVKETKAQLKVFDKSLNKLSIPELEKLEEKIQFVEQEIVNVKNTQIKHSNSMKLETSIKSKSKGGEKFTSEEIRNFGEELDAISLFVQRFADTHIFDQIRIIKDPDVTVKEKMDTMDWLARNSEFISTDAVTNCLKEFQELYSVENPQRKNEYINSRNHSMAVVNVLQLIEHTEKLEPDEDTDYKFSLYYSILEPLLKNNYNLEKAADMEIIDVIMRSLVQSLRELESIKSRDPGMKGYVYQKYKFDLKSEEVLPKNHLFKYILRCLTSCMRNQKIIQSFLCDNEDNIRVILKIIEKVRDEEILANSNKILRIIFRDDHRVNDFLIERRQKFKTNEVKAYLGMDENTLSEVINSILEGIGNNDFSEIVLVESTAAALNFVKNKDLIKFIVPQNIQNLIKLVTENYEKPRVLAIQCIQIIAELEEYKKYIINLGAEDILEIDV